MVDDHPRNEANGIEITEERTATVGAVNSDEIRTLQGIEISAKELEVRDGWNDELLEQNFASVDSRLLAEGRGWQTTMCGVAGAAVRADRIAIHGSAAAIVELTAFGLEIGARFRLAALVLDAPTRAAGK